MKYLKIELFQHSWQFFGKTGLSRFWHKGDNQRFFHERKIYKQKDFHIDLDERIDNIFQEKNWVETATNFNTICTFWRFFNVKFSERFLPADLFLKRFCNFLIPERLGRRKKTQKRVHLLTLYSQILTDLWIFNFFRLLRKTKRSFLCFWKKPKKSYLLQLCRKTVDFWERKASFQKTLIIFEKKF